jgi:uncharacterized protein (DUF58 family)
VTPRGKALAGATIVAYVASRALGVAELQMVAIAMVALLVGAYVQTSRNVAHLRVTREIEPATLVFGERARVTLTVHNDGRATTPSLELADMLPQDLGQNPRARVVAVPPASKRTAEYELEGTRRGTVTIGPMMVRSADPFGLVVRDRPVASTLTTTIYPRVDRLPPGLVLEGSAARGRGTSRRPGASGEELGDVREYVEGDDLRAIHWASTARRGALIVRLSESPQTPGAILLLDIRADRHAGVGATSSFESVVSAGASLCRHLSTRGCPVALVDKPTGVAPVAAPWATLLDRLAELRPAVLDFDGALRQVARGVARSGTAVGVVTTPDTLERRKIVRVMRGFASRAVLVVDVASHTARGPDPSAADAVATLRASGVPSAVLRRGDRVADRWQEVLGRNRAPLSGGAR